MKHFFSRFTRNYAYLSLFVFIVTLYTSHFTLHAQPTFARGADVSWCTEMEADGKKFYDAGGNETELMSLLRQMGMNTVRLRVWVNPENDYGAWSDKHDVLEKARRAHQQGLDIMLNFHYSDLFADPGRQNKPAAWQGLSGQALCQAVADHTTDILQALYDEGIEPRYVQVGNETRNGMIWDDGKLWKSSTNNGYDDYVPLSNAGYDAAKAIFPNTLVLIHIDRGREDNTWFYRDLQDHGAKFDMIGLSHYPSSSAWQTDNQQIATNISKLYQTFHLPVMIVETGMPIWDDATTATAVSAMTDLFNRVENLQGCNGILYWEPEVYNWWKPAAYTRWGWNGYNMGAFLWNGRPGPALDPFRQEVEPDAIRSVEREACQVEDEASKTYNLAGQQIPDGRAGLVIHQGKKMLRK